MESANLRVVIIVQARMGATRLPGKPLKQVLEKPLLAYLIERLRRTKCADEIIVATTTLERDDPIVTLCSEMQVPIFRGSEEDVLDRYYEAAKSSAADCIVRITGDCPLIDPKMVDDVIEAFLENAPDVDYVSNVLTRTFPRGMDVEAFSFEALEIAANEAKNESDREHVTPFLYGNKERFSLLNVSQDEDQSKYRLTVDTQDDFVLISKILEGLYPTKADFSLGDVMELMEKNPEWEKINAHVVQKPTCFCTEDE